MSLHVDGVHVFNVIDPLNIGQLVAGYPTLLGHYKRGRIASALGKCRSVTNAAT